MPTRSRAGTSTAGSSTRHRRKTTTTATEKPLVQPRSRKAWRAWLQKHHATSSGVWLVLAKKHTGIPSVSYNDAVEEALCFGWIDGLAHPVDATCYKQSFTPRKPKSTWAATNKARVAQLIAAGLMTAAGMKLVALAKKTGTWDALTPVDAMTIPPELAAALRDTPAAQRTFDAYPPGVKKQCLYYLNDAKRPETKAKRIAALVDAAAKGLRPFAAVSTTKATKHTKTT